MKPNFLKHAAASLMGLIALATSIVYAQTLSQEPLLSKAVSVRPNLSFIMDTSGSMAWACAYAPHAQKTIDTQFRPNYPTDIPGTSQDCLGSSKEINNNNVTFGQRTDLRHASPDNNFLIYDPRKYYPPGITDAGAKQANSTASWTDLSDHKGDVASMSTGGTRKGYAVILAVPAFSLVISTSTVAQQTSAANYTTSWILETTNAFGTVNSAGTVVSTTNNPFPQTAARTDCGGTTCTWALERQNLQNWFTYHKTRLSAAKVGINTAFTGLPDSFRMNYVKLGDSSISSVRNYTDTVTPFRTWINARTASGGTPLKAALNLVGTHYENNTANTGPWGNTPWSAGNEAATSHLSCRRSFAVMVTDGYWSDNSVANSSVGNSDGRAGAEIKHFNSTTVASFTYSPGNTSDIRNKGKADLRASGTGYSDTLADYAHYFWSRDLRGDLVNNVSDGKASSPAFWQSLSTYTVGFGVDGSLSQTDIDKAKAATLNWTEPKSEQTTTVDDLKHAAHNSGGEYISVRDSADFSTKLRNVLLSIAGESSSQAGVAASTTILQTGTKKYVPYYTTGEWWGNLSAVSLDPATGADIAPNAWNVVGLDANGRPNGTTTIPSFSTRKVFVYSNSTTMALSFNSTNMVTTTGLVGSNTNQATTTFTADMVNYIRGDRSQEGSGKPFRERAALLGDIVNSRPTFVKNITDPNSAYANLPSSAGGGSSYTAYKATKAARTEGVLFVGANDGMLHAFAESNGAEKFAFIPRSVLGNLHLLTDKNYALNHKMFVDGPLKESDAYIPTRNAAGTFGTATWTNVITGTTGAGAKAVFALNVTDPHNMLGHHAMWEVSHLTTGFGELGHVLSEVDTGVTASGDWVAVFGNGYSSASGKASLFLVNLSTGAKIKELTTNNDLSNGLGGVRLVRNANSQIIGAYAGDLLGNVWRFDLSGASSTNWGNGQLLFSAKSTPGANAQPITAAPAVFARNDGRTGYIVVVGTGRLLTSTDSDPANSTFKESAYGLWDTATFGGTATFSTITGRASLVQNSSVLSSTSSTSDLYSVTSSTTVNWDTQKGWVLDYTVLEGQRSIYPVEALQTLVRIDTIAPRSNTSSCTVDGQIKGVNYLLDPYSGVCRTRTTVDTNGDGKIDADDTKACIYTGLGDGSNTVLDHRTTTGWKYVVGATDRRLVDDNPDGGPTTAAACNISTDPSKCRIRRDVRQVFIRK
jgi:type IV pilus assembly protein PilY1